jgi:hypothetical protein
MYYKKNWLVIIINLILLMKQKQESGSRLKIIKKSNLLLNGKNLHNNWYKLTKYIANVYK